METGTTSKPWKKIFIGSMIAAAIIYGVTLYLFINEKQEKNIVITQKTSLEGEYHTVLDSLDARSMQIEQLRGINDDMDKKIDEQQQMIEQEKAELARQFEQNTLTTAELSNARAKIREYKVSIAALQQQVAEYEVKTQQLTVEKEQLSCDLVCEKETNTALTEVNETLTAKVDEGSFLQLSKVNVEAIKKKRNGEEVPVDKIKAMENLKISFETGVNKVLDPGQLSLYVRIINPRGETIAISEQGSGVIPETESGKPVQFTKKANIQWNQNNKKVVMYWNRYITNPGTYKVEVYQSGRVIGKGAVRLS